MPSAVEPRSARGRRTPRSRGRPSRPSWSRRRRPQTGIPAAMPLAIPEPPPPRATSRAPLRRRTRRARRPPGPVARQSSPRRASPSRLSARAARARRPRGRHRSARGGVSGTRVMRADHHREDPDAARGDRLHERQRRQRERDDIEQPARRPPKAEAHQPAAVPRAASAPTRSAGAARAAAPSRRRCTRQVTDVQRKGRDERQHEGNHDARHGPMLRQRDPSEPSGRDRHRLVADFEAGAIRVAHASHASAAARIRRIFSGVTISSGSPKPGPPFAFTSQKTSRRPRRSDEVDLVAARPHVRAEDAVAAQPVVETRAALGRPAGAACRAGSRFASR